MTLWRVKCTRRGPNKTWAPWGWRDLKAQERFQLLLAMQSGMLVMPL